jgi:hypothetical protein
VLKRKPVIATPPISPDQKSSVPPHKLLKATEKKDERQQFLDGGFIANLNKAVADLNKAVEALTTSQKTIKDNTESILESQKPGLFDFLMNFGNWFVASLGSDCLPQPKQKKH